MTKDKKKLMITLIKNDSKVLDETFMLIDADDKQAFFIGKMVELPSVLKQIGNKYRIHDHSYKYDATMNIHEIYVKKKEG